MKKTLIYILALVSVIATGCKKETPQAPETLQDKICGEWKCTPSSIDATIYASFTADGKFELYQKIGDGGHRLYRGKWSLDGEVISGTYNDGKAWGSVYNVSMKEDKSSMKWTASNGEENTYSRCEIPAEIKENSVIEVKAAENDSQPLCFF